MAVKSLNYFRPAFEKASIEALQELLPRHPTIGFLKYYYRLRRKGVLCNHKRFYRMFTILQLNVRRKVKKRISGSIFQILF